MFSTWQRKQTVRSTLRQPPRPTGAVGWSQDLLQTIQQSTTPCNTGLVTNYPAVYHTLQHRICYILSSSLPHPATQDLLHTLPHTKKTGLVTHYLAVYDSVMQTLIKITFKTNLPVMVFIDFKICLPTNMKIKPNWPPKLPKDIVYTIKKNMPTST